MHAHDALEEVHAVPSWARLRPVGAVGRRLLSPCVGSLCLESTRIAVYHRLAPSRGISSRCVLPRGALLRRLAGLGQLASLKVGWERVATSFEGHAQDGGIFGVRVLFAAAKPVGNGRPGDRNAAARGRRRA